MRISKFFCLKSAVDFAGSDVTASADQRRKAAYRRELEQQMQATKVQKTRSVLLFI
jgi:hypothetical protein